MADKKEDTKNKEPSHHGIKEEKEKIGGEYPNETLKLLIERASCRSFKDEKISDEMLRLILESGVHAATGGNLQPYSIIQIENSEVRAKLAEMCGQAFMAKAPLHFLYCIDWHRIERWAKLEKAPFSASQSFRHFWISFQDTIIAAQNMCTAIDALGLGSVYIGTIMEFIPEVRRMFDLPSGVFPVVLLCLGHPKARPTPRKKLGPEVVVHHEKYRELGDKELVEAFKGKYPDLKIEATPERIEQIKKVCETVHGPGYAKETLARIELQGYINAVQRYFGLHYVADEMCADNEKFVAQIRQSGFEWFIDPETKPDGV